MTIKDYIIIIFFLLFTTALQAQSHNSQRARSAHQARSLTPQQEKKNLALQYYRNKEYNKAAAILDKLYKTTPTHSIYNYLYYSLFYLQKYDKAKKITKSQIRNYPDIPGYKINLGYIYITQGDTKKGEKIYSRVIKNLPPDQAKIQSAALAFRSHREDDKAIEVYLQGRKLLKKPYLFGLEIGSIYDRAGQYEKMFDEYLHLLAYNNSKITLVQYRLQNSLNNDSDNSKSEYFRTSLLKLIHKYPDKRIYSDLLLWLSIQQKDFTTALLQAKALNNRFNENGEQILQLGDLCAENQQYDNAIDAYNYVLKHCDKDDPIIIDAKTKLLDTKQKEILKNTTPQQKELYKLKEEYINTIEKIGKNKYSFNMLRNLAHLQAFWLHETKEAISLLQNALTLHDISKQDIADTKLELADIYLHSNNPWEATLLYSQVEKSFKNQPIGHKAKYKNAMLSYYIGEYKWALAQFKVLKAATSKLIANDAMAMNLFLTENMENDSVNEPMHLFSTAQMLIFRNNPDSALQLLDTILSRYTFTKLNDDVLFAKADIFKQKGLFSKADTLYTQVYENFPNEILADNAVMQSAEINQYHLYNTKKAIALYKAILTEYSGSIFAEKARHRYRTLREKK